MHRSAAAELKMITKNTSYACLVKQNDNILLVYVIVYSYIYIGIIHNTKIL